MRKANLDLMNWKYECSDESSSSCSEAPKTRKKTLKNKKKKKKRTAPDRSMQTVTTNEFKVNEILPEKTPVKHSKNKPANILQPIQHR